MPVLDLLQEQISDPTELDLRYLEAVMLWPDEPETRTDALSTVRAEMLVSAAKNASPDADSRDWLVSAKELSLLRKAPRREDIKWQGRALRGYFVGRVLLEALGPQIWGGKISGLKSTRKALLDHLRNQFKDQAAFHVDDPSTEIWWKRFRPVAHFWAARLMLVQIAEISNSDAPPFPCRRDQLREFLAIAEAIRKRGENSKSTPRSPRTILQPGEAFYVSPDTPLPEIEFGT
jgi:hypothetical protein